VAKTEVFALAIQKGGRCCDPFRAHERNSAFQSIVTLKHAHKPFAMIEWPLAMCSIGYENVKRHRYKPRRYIMIMKVTTWLEKALRRDASRSSRLMAKMGAIAPEEVVLTP